MEKSKKLSSEAEQTLIEILENRFNKNMHRHPNMLWSEVSDKLRKHPDKLWSLSKMEDSLGEPDVIGVDHKTGELLFVDCSKESPAGRRSCCYDRAGLESRKEHRPLNNAVDLAEEMGLALLTEEEYRNLQKVGEFDTKTSSWLKTPEEIRKYGGAIFGDFRYKSVFIYHNGAQSYYAARGFRGVLRI